MKRPCDIISSEDWIAPGETDRIGGKKGAYVLWIRLDDVVTIEASRLSADLDAGVYLYAGSAYGPGGLGARLNRHFKKEKRRRWHVDSLTVEACDLAALPVENGRECDLVAKLLKVKAVDVALGGFGSSDCRSCRSHLLIAR